ncbi:DUF2158 domain-containing protein [Serratia sp. RJAL6]|uniref:YodC family protein n=1 Tax=Serratia marcescens TaxID=615 RepID=UPI0011F1F6CF|nr:DUF2158 domain-containing protein [Serratia marcescens]KAB5494668.1 DUF2158 domain-containing protein [Enterobacter sp. RJAL6]
MSIRYAIGQKVMLKSGGPVMTVEVIGTDWDRGTLQHEFNNTYVCQWFAGKKLERDSFPQDSLDLVE